MPVTTRSQSKVENRGHSEIKEILQVKQVEDTQETKPIYEVNIDFDEASELWKANKRRIGEGCYRYVCAKKGKYKNQCLAKCLAGLDYCRTHYKMFLDGKI